MIKKVTAALSEKVNRWRDIGLQRVSLLTAARGAKGAIVAILPLPLIITGVIALALTGCDNNNCECHHNDSLSDRMAKVKVSFEWDPRFQETPSGVTILAYASNGSLYNSVKSNSIDQTELYLPQGEFTIIAFNQSLAELLPIWFDTYEKLDNCRITLSELETSPSFITGNSPQSSDEPEEKEEEKDKQSSLSTSAGESDNGSGNDNSNIGSTSSDTMTIAQTVTEKFVEPSPWLALSQPQVVNITEDELMNLNTRCKCKVCCCGPLHEAINTTHFLTLNMLPQVYTLQVNLSIKNLPSLASVKAYVRGLNCSINLLGKPLEDPASMLLEQWQKSMTTDTDGVISSKTTCLSMAVTDQSALVIEFSLTDGKKSFVRILPLNDKVKIDRQIMTITAELELEEPLPKVEGEPAGAFWVTVTDWGEAKDIDI